MAERTVSCVGEQLQCKVSLNGGWPTQSEEMLCAANVLSPPDALGAGKFGVELADLEHHDCSEDVVVVEKLLDRESVTKGLECLRTFVVGDAANLDQAERI
ncbi:hypothetical protein LTR53_000140 [Teratosphaeriaceae sp. CCFEE 6253]|nr:hypothetical protein LTR53_000140 [Teratosphaeriaceae sp. CCFEE 6253]